MAAYTRLDEPARARVAVEAHAHLVHDVAEPDAVLGIGEAHRAAHAGVPEGAAPAVGRERRGHEEAEAEGGLEVEALVRAVGLQLRGLRHLVGVEERAGGATVDGAGEAGVEAGQRAGVRDAVGGRDLRRAHGRVVEAALGVGQHAVGRAQRLAEQRVGAHELLDQLRERGIAGASSAAAPSAPHWMSGATRCCCSSGSPIQNSSPSGSRDLVVEERAEALARRCASPPRRPASRRWWRGSRGRCRAPTPAPAPRAPGSSAPTPAPRRG